MMHIVNLRGGLKTGVECPDNINDCEQVKRWTLGWTMDVDLLAET
jgi:hypothetical protein